MGLLVSQSVRYIFLQIYVQNIRFWYLSLPHFCYLVDLNYEISGFKAPSNNDMLDNLCKMAAAFVQETIPYEKYIQQVHCRVLYSELATEHEMDFLIYS